MKYFKHIEAVLSVICIAASIASFVAAFQKPHCFIMAAFYTILATVLVKAAIESKKEEDRYA